MPEERARETDDVKRTRAAQDVAPRDHRHGIPPFLGMLPHQGPGLLSDGRLGLGANHSLRHEAVHSAQRTHGNRAVQRFLSRPQSAPRTHSRSPLPVQRYQIGFGPGMEPIHQILTAEALKKAGMLGEGGTWESPDAQEYSRGVIWNDDPLTQLMRPDKFQKSWEGSIGFANDFMEYEEEAVRRSQAGEAGFGPGESLLARTHFGDLQFLHGMAAKDKETAPETLDKMMKWAQFSTMIAQGDIKGDTKFSDLAKMKGMEDVAALFPDMKDQDINSLYGIKDGKGDVKQRAMGSLLHMVQDSYAGGHVQRNEKGEVVSFHSYTDQDHSKHGHSDELGEGETLEEQLKNTAGANKAIDKGADVLKLVNKGVPWPEIEKHLRKDVFALADPTVPAGPGTGYEKEEEHGLWESIKEGGLGGLKDWAGHKAGEAWGGVKEGLIKAAHTTGAGKALDWAGDKWDEVSDTASETWDAAKTKASETWSSAKDTASEYWDATKTKASETWDSAKDTASGYWDAAKTGVSETWDSTKTKAAEKWESAKTGASEYWETTKSGASEAWDAAGEAAGRGAANAWDWMTTW